MPWLTGPARLRPVVERRHACHPRPQARTEVFPGDAVAQMRRSGPAARSRPHAMPPPAAMEGHAPPLARSGARPSGEGSGGGRPAGTSELRRGSTLNLASAAVSAIATTGATVLVARAFGKAE